MKRRIYRDWWQVVYLSASFGVFLLISVSYFTVGNPGRHYFRLAPYSVVGAGAILLLWRTARLGVAVNDRGVEVPALGRGTLMPWSDVDGVTCDQYDLRLDLPLYARFCVSDPARRCR